MGFRDLFGGKNKAVEQERIIEEQKEKDHEAVIEDQKKAHEGLAWPDVPRLNILNQKDDRLKVENPLTPERRDEVGQLVYEPDLKPEMIQDLSVQELLFLLLAEAVFNRKEPLRNYEKNYRVIYNEFLDRLHRAEKFYVLYDKRTGYPLIDGGFVPVYLEKDKADKAAELYKLQFRDATVVTQPGEAAPEDENGKRPMALFDYLYYIGAENVVVDNGWYKGVVKRSEMSAPMDWNSDPKNTPPSNPDLVFAMTDYVSEMRWPVKYDKRDDVIRRKTDRMMALIPKGRYIVPTKVAPVDPAEAVKHIGPDGKPVTQQVQFPAVKIKDKMYMPVFTDMFEYGRRFGKTDMKPAGFEYRNLLQFLKGPMAGLIINPGGQGILVPAAKAESLLFTASGNAGGNPQTSSASRQRTASSGQNGTSGGQNGSASGQNSRSGGQNGSAGASVSSGSTDPAGEDPYAGGKVVNFAELAKKHAEKTAGNGPESQ